jgi:hypothetical protein
MLHCLRAAGLLGLAGTIVVAAPAGAQITGPGVPTTPTTAQIDQLSSLFRISVNLRTAAGTVITDTYGLNLAERSYEFMDPVRLRERYGAQYTNQSAVAGMMDFRGLAILGFYDANSTTFRISVPELDRAGEDYTRIFTGPTRDAAYAQFDSYLEDIEDEDAERLVRALLRALARTSPIDPLAGNPGSIQGSLVRSSLDMSSSDSAIEQDAASGGTNTPGDPWIVGANYSWGSSNGGRYEFKRVDGRVARSFRLGEGGRALLKFDTPFTYSEVNGARAVSIQTAVAVEVPLIARRWSVEPRLGYGLTASDQIGSLGHMVSTTLASRFIVGNVGRGRLVIGNMAGYTQTLSTGFTGYNINPGLKNWVFRNGLAYDLPLKFRGMGRNTSVRASYSFTNYAGDDLYFDKFHEVGLSIGLRGREESARNGRDLIRLNFSLVKASDYSSWSAGIGFRF